MSHVPRKNKANEWVVGRVVGWLVGWLVDGLLNESSGWLVGWLVDGLVSRVGQGGVGWSPIKAKKASKRESRLDQKE